MAAFPTLTPSAAPITPGAWPVATISSLNGAESRIRQGSAQIGRRLQLTFTNVTEADFLAILNHYRGQRSGFDSFGFNTATLAADLTPAGYGWLYASRPQVVDEHADVFTVVCEFKAEPRGLVVAMGKAWRTLATTLAARSVAAGKQWATTSTTLNPGARSSGVGSNGVAWVTTTTTLITRDPYFSSVSLLLHMDGSSGSTTFTDSSSNGLAVTAYGDAQVSTTDPKYGSGSLTLDGTGDYLQTAASSVLALGTGDFTVECWVYVVSGTSNNGLFTFGGQGSGLAVSIYNGNWSLTPDGSGGATMGAVTTGSWQHLAVTRSGSSLRLFINGTQLGSTLGNSTNFTDNQLKIGYYFNSSYAINAKVDEFRVTKGIARETANFTPYDGPFLDY
jgi:hypothetical protein